MFSEFDKLCMNEALVEAKKAFDVGEVPVGAVLTKDGEIVSRGFNEVESSKSATRHAEMVCIHKASKVFGDWRLCDTKLYVTVEPCLMCLGACILSRVDTILFGAKEPRHGACVSLLDAMSISHPIHNITICSGLFEEECRKLMKKFFLIRRY